MALSDPVKKHPIRVGIVAGEISGDILGAGLIDALKSYDLDMTFEGIAGPRMIEAGCKSLYPLDDLSVMGLIEPILRVPRILFIRRKLYQHFVKFPPDVFIGIDAPDFNLTLENKLKMHHIPTIQYVSPQIWAWRQGRKHKIKRATNRVLVLYPFEKIFYDKLNIPAALVGHALADEIFFETPKKPSRILLDVPLDVPIVTLMPGSRKGVMRYLSKPFLETAYWLVKKVPDIQFLVGCTNEKRAEEFKNILKCFPHKLPIKIVVDHARQVISAADVVLLSSGTGTLETLLIKRPMVVAYKMSKISFAFAKRVVKVNHIALPNLLANERLVPEFLQDDVTSDKMGPCVLDFLKNDNSRLMQKFQKIHHSIKLNASEVAASEILKQIKK